MAASARPAVYKFWREHARAISTRQVTVMEVNQRIQRLLIGGVVWSSRRRLRRLGGTGRRLGVRPSDGGVPPLRGRGVGEPGRDRVGAGGGSASLLPAVP